MKKTKALFAALLLMVAGNVMADNKVTCNDVTIKAGETAKINIAVYNDVDISGVAFQLYLPDGVTVKKKSNGKYTYTAGSRLKDEDEELIFTINVTDTEDGGVQFGFGGADVITGESGGSVMSITLEAAADAVSAVTEGYLKNISMSDPNQTSLLLNDPDKQTYAFTVTIEGTVPVGIQEVEAANANAPIYNLGGQRVEKTAKGLYIKNGKKVVVK
jgi:hypothetical protein